MLANQALIIHLGSTINQGLEPRQLSEIPLQDVHSLLLGSHSTSATLLELTMGLELRFRCVADDYSADISEPFMTGHFFGRFQRKIISVWSIHAQVPCKSNKPPACYAKLCFITE